MQISALSTQSDKKSTQDPANMNIKSKAPIGVEIFSEELYKLPKEEIGKITGYSVKKVVDKARKDT